MSVVIILIAFLATFIIACKQTGNRRIPMLKNRQEDSDAWIFADMDPTITEAYLGIIANAFMLHGPEQILQSLSERQAASSPHAHPQHPADSACRPFPAPANGVAPGVAPPDGR